jgi:hypothetical protein
VFPRTGGPGESFKGDEANVLNVPITPPIKPPDFHRSVWKLFIEVIGEVDSVEVAD